MLYISGSSRQEKGKDKLAWRVKLMMFHILILLYMISCRFVWIFVVTHVLGLYYFVMYIICDIS